MTRALDFLEGELRRLGAVNSVISTNIQPRLDGRPRGGQAKPLDTGAAVYFTLGKVRVVLPCDRWNRTEDNLWAIGKHIEAMRGQNRWGVGEIERAFAGYATLPEKREDSCWEILGISDTATEQQVLDAYRREARRTHPDAGGSSEAFQRVCSAKDIALSTIKYSHQ